MIAVYEKHLFTPDQLVVGVHQDGDHLGPFALLADAASFKRKAARLADRGRLMLVADMPIHPIPGHSWSEDLVPFDILAERLGAKRHGPSLILEVEPVLVKTAQLSKPDDRRTILVNRSSFVPEAVLQKVLLGNGTRLLGLS